MQEKFIESGERSIDFREEEKMLEDADPAIRAVLLRITRAAAEAKR